MRYLLIFLMSLAFINILERVNLPLTPDGIHFQGWTSDTMMQALPIKALRDTPLESLWYLHKQPPMLDIIRAIIAQFFHDTPQDKLLNRVDTVIYVVWSLFFAGMATLIYFWMEFITNRYWAFFASLVWMFHPAPIYYATLLEGTFISSFFILWFFYELWRMGYDGGSILRLTLVSVLLFYTRTIFQWYFFPILFFSMFLLGVNHRRILIYALSIFLLITPLILKQYVLFKTVITTTFVGYYKTSMIWYNPEPKEVEDIKKTIKVKYPPEADKYNGGDRFNNEELFLKNIIYSALIDKKFKDSPKEHINQILKSLKYNFNVYWLPSTDYMYHVLLEALPWRKAYNFIFSKSIYISLILIASIIAFILNDTRSLLSRGKKSVGLIIPVVYILLPCLFCNVFDSSEAQRLKFFLEPLFFILIMSQFYLAALAIIKIKLVKN